MLNILQDIEVGIPVMFLGMGVVFLVLMLLWGVLEMFRVLFYAGPMKNEAAKTAAAAAPQSSQSIAEDQEELIAICSAAISTMLEKPANSLRIHSIRRK